MACALWLWMLTSAGGAGSAMRDTHTVTNHRGHSDQTDTVTLCLFLFKIRETKPMLPYA